MGSIVAAIMWVVPHTAASDARHLLTIYDRGQQVGIMTNASTIASALAENHIELAANDRVEPARDSKLIAPNYQVNIYRARPIVIVDGQTKVRVLSAYRTPAQIAQSAGIVLHSEDKTTIVPTENIVANGAGLEMKITRATPFTLVLYGKKIPSYTQAKTVGAMLKEKGITLAKSDTVSAPLASKLTRGMKVAVWRNGAQTVTVNQPIKFKTKQIKDFDHEIGYKAIKTKGELGTKSVTYQIVMRRGKEVSRHKIQSIVINQPVEQVEIIGVKPGPNALTKAKGSDMFQDSRGVIHRETYYDLPMQTAVSTCGGTYTIRADGAKVDQDGYVLVAANLARYPRCSVVETSLGPGKVYDTGGFVSRYPDGFDLATDWTNYDGR